MAYLTAIAFVLAALYVVHLRESLDKTKSSLALLEIRVGELSQALGANGNSARWHRADTEALEWVLLRFSARTGLLKHPTEPSADLETIRKALALMSEDIREAVSTGGSHGEVGKAGLDIWSPLHAQSE